MNNIETAEDYVGGRFAIWNSTDESGDSEQVVNYYDCLQAMREFAKLHLEAAQKAYSKENIQ